MRMFVFFYICCGFKDYSKYGLGDHNSLMYAASKYLKMAKMSKEKIVKYAGKDSLEKLNKLLEMVIF